MAKYREVTEHITIGQGENKYTVSLTGQWDGEQFEQTGLDWVSGDFWEFALDMQAKNLTVERLEEMAIQQLTESEVRL